MNDVLLRIQKYLKEVGQSREKTLDHPQVSDGPSD